MRKYLLLIFFALFSFSAIHAEIEWTLSDDGTLTISGTDMPDYRIFMIQTLGKLLLLGIVNERKSRRL